MARKNHGAPIGPTQHTHPLTCPCITRGPYRTRGARERTGKRKTINGSWESGRLLRASPHSRAWSALEKPKPAGNSGTLADHAGDRRRPLGWRSPGSQFPRLLPAPEPDPTPVSSRIMAGQEHGFLAPPRLGLAVTCGVKVTVCVRLLTALWAPWRPGPESLMLLPHLASLPARRRPSPGPPHGAGAAGLTQRASGQPPHGHPACRRADV